MEIQFTQNVRIICDLGIGDTVRTNQFGYKLDNKDWIIEDIRYSKNCDCGFLVKINGYDRYLSATWLIKK